MRETLQRPRELPAVLRGNYRPKKPLPHEVRKSREPGLTFLGRFSFCQNRTDRIAGLHFRAVPRDIRQPLWQAPLTPIQFGFQPFDTPPHQGIDDELALASLSMTARLTVACLPLVPASLSCY